MMVRRVKFVFVFIIVMMKFGLLSTAWSQTVSENAIVYLDGKYVLKLDETSLEEVVELFRGYYAVEILGLEPSYGDMITVQISEAKFDQVVKTLLRNLGVKNYAFEYNDETLRRVYVLPVSGLLPRADFFGEKQPIPEQSYLNAVEIVEVVKDSQAQTIGLQTGDFVVEYDGVRIRNARQLVNEAGNTTTDQQVEMIVLRDQLPVSFILHGGFIGIKIRTRRIAQQDFSVVGSKEDIEKWLK
jgi:hypothetical protein